MTTKVHVKPAFNIDNVIQHKSGTAAAWTADNPILRDGEIGIEESSTTPKFKTGDGVTHWNDLPYAGSATTSSVPTGTGFRHVTAGVEDGAAVTISVDGQSIAGSTNVPVIAPGTHAATSKTTPVAADELPIVDSAASNVLKKLTFTNLWASVWAALGGSISTGTGKTTPVDADAFALMDSAASNATKSLTYASLKSAIATYIGTLVPGTIAGTPPLAANFSAFGAATTTFTDKTGRMQITCTASTTATQLRGIVQTASLPAAPYTIDLAGTIITTTGSADVGELGLCLSNGTQYRYIGVGACDTATGGTTAGVRVRVLNFTAASGGSASILTGGQDGMTVSPAMIYLRITDDGSTRRFWVSNNGKDFVQILSEANTTGFTATKCGICIYNIAMNSIPPKASITNWLITGSVLGDAA